MQKLKILIFLVVVTFNMCVAQSKWIWSEAKPNPTGHNYYPAADKRNYYVGNQYNRADRDREPRTKRPIAGQAQNDDIDDYTDANDDTIRQYSPYIPPGAIGNPLVAGNYNGFGNYPQISGFSGNTPNGILVGPGGPTGIIGRPQAQYPGYPVAHNIPAGAVNNNHGLPGYNALNILGQYPYGNPSNPQQFAGAQYPQYQFPTVQYPPQPQYTEGYGLAHLNSGFKENLGFNPQFNGNVHPNYGFGFDEFPGKVEGKSASVKAINKKVDDKVAKNVQKL